MIVVRLKEVAESKGYNLSRLQKASGVDLGVMRRFWKWDGTLESVHLSSLDKLCAVLDCEPGDLIKRIPPGHIGDITLEARGVAPPTPP